MLPLGGIWRETKTRAGTGPPGVGAGGLVGVTVGVVVGVAVGAEPGMGVLVGVLVGVAVGVLVGSAPDMAVAVAVGVAVRRPRRPRQMLIRMDLAGPTAPLALARA